MKKLVCLVLALTILCSVTAALADPTTIDGSAKRNIKINEAGLNTDPQEMVNNLVSPTTGRKLDEIPQVPDGFVGAAVTGKYQPVMAQISNESNGVGVTNGKLYAIAPINGSYGDIFYFSPQKYGGNQTRMTVVFSDTIPDYIGFIRSTRLTHARIRQEWDCAFLTSGYSEADVPDEWIRLGVKNPAGKRTEEDPGLVYVGDYPKVWKQYVWRLGGINDSNSELFEAAKIAQYIIPKDHVPANHTFLFSDEEATGGDDGKFIYITLGNTYESDCRLEYDDELKAYIRYVYVRDSEDQPYCETVLVNPEIKAVKDKNGNKIKKVVAEDRVVGEKITFSNVIIQGIKMKWRSGLRPDPQLVGEGNADYFMGGRHYSGVWQRKDDNARTVYYDENGNEIKLQPGRTLIVLIDYSEKIDDKGTTANVKYE